MSQFDEYVDQNVAHWPHWLFYICITGLIYCAMNFDDLKDQMSEIEKQSKLNENEALQVAENWFNEKFGNTFRIKLKYKEVTNDKNREILKKVKKRDLITILTADERDKANADMILSLYIDPKNNKWHVDKHCTPATKKYLEGMVKLFKALNSDKEAIEWLTAFRHECGKYIDDTWNIIPVFMNWVVLGFAKGSGDVKKNWTEVIIKLKHKKNEKDKALRQQFEKRDQIFSSIYLIFALGFALSTLYVLIHAFDYVRGYRIHPEYQKKEEKQQRVHLSKKNQVKIAAKRKQKKEQKLQELYDRQSWEAQRKERILKIIDKSLHETMSLQDLIDPLASLDKNMQAAFLKNLQRLITPKEEESNLTKEEIERFNTIAVQYQELEELSSDSYLDTLLEKVDDDKKRKGLENRLKKFRKTVVSINPVDLLNQWEKMEMESKNSFADT